MGVKVEMLEPQELRKEMKKRITNIKLQEWIEIKEVIRE